MNQIFTTIAAPLPEKVIGTKVIGTNSLGNVESPPKEVESPPKEQDKANEMMRSSTNGGGHPHPQLRPGSSSPNKDEFDQVKRDLEELKIKNEQPKSERPPVGTKKLKIFEIWMVENVLYRETGLMGELGKDLYEDYKSFVQRLENANVKKKDTDVKKKGDEIVSYKIFSKCFLYVAHAILEWKHVTKKEGRMLMYTNIELKHNDISKIQRNNGWKLVVSS